MQKRSLFQMIFGKNNKEPTNTTYLKLLSSYIPTFSPFGDEAYDSDLVRAAVDTIARNAAKLKPKHIRRVNGDIIPQDSQIQRLLQTRPNPYMDAFTFYYKVITQLYLKNNSFIFIDADPTGNVRGFYPLNASTIELLEARGEIFVRFTFLGGDRVILPYTSLIHLRRHFYKNDFYGETNDTALLPTLELINTTNQGIINAIKSSANLRGLLKFSQAMLKPEDIKKERDRFVTEYMDITNNGGVAALDAKADYIELKNDPKIIDKDTMNHIKQTVYDYFGVNENIIQSKYTEDEWNAFYESTIEPLAVQMSLEFTSKLFTEREQGFGNEIIFEANRLQYASTKTKVQLINTMMPLGILTINEAREILNLAPVEDGDKRLVSLNFVNAQIQDQYQLGGDDVGKKAEGDEINRDTSSTE
ncbi:phage portal protein [Tepidibacillus sp. LV47]|uniref:phage portal protein n=1 Tax=Tepidibacillus sp. LV47 TaxID=3398228 RepID=UPI003AAA4201